MALEQECSERSETQMTLGGMISALEAMPDNTKVTGLDSPHSYRGYYSDLAFELKTEKVTLVICLPSAKMPWEKCLKATKAATL